MNEDPNNTVVHLPATVCAKIHMNSHNMLAREKILFFFLIVTYLEKSLLY